MSTPNKTFRPCVIHVGDNQALSAAVQRELFARGYKWASGSVHTAHYAERAIRTGGDYGDGCFGTTYWPNSGTTFDLTTQPLGALLEYLDKPEEVKVEVVGCERVRIYSDSLNTKGGATLYLKGRVSILELMPNEIDALYAASQAARKEGK